MLPSRAVVVAQLVEKLLPTLESEIQIPTSANFYLPIVHLNRNDENKEKEAGNGPSLRKVLPSNVLLRLIFTHKIIDFILRSILHLALRSY